MVFFKSDVSSSGVENLVVLSDGNQPIKRGVTLRVGTALTGNYVERWSPLANSPLMENWTAEYIRKSGKPTGLWTLCASHHDKSSDTTPFSTLGRRIIQGEAKWDDAPLHFPGEFHYFSGHGEWTEDVLSRCESKLVTSRLYSPIYASLFTYDRNPNIVKAFCEAWSPSTNTLLTSYGELSISLWDIHFIAGLSISGSLYDEVIPGKEELCGRDAAGDPFIPRSCQVLFHSFYLLRGKPGDHLVSVEDWIKFWSKKEIKYQCPPLRTEKKGPRPKLTHNPLGDFDVHRTWSKAEEDLFSKLGVKGSLREKAFLAAHLACWLCTFVLPIKDVGFIRPSTFRMASIMASGQRVSLAIPVLASIYKGLNVISNSSQPTQENFPFPIHFVYGWLAQYFNTHFNIYKTPRVPQMMEFSGEGMAKLYDAALARKRIHIGDCADWACNAILKAKGILFVDNNSASEDERSYFASIRSCYLTLRQGDIFFVEPYSPHRFSRQFGFYQDVPGVLKFDQREASLMEGLRFWRISVQHKFTSKAWLPGKAIGLRSFYSEGYKSWLFGTNMKYLEAHIDDLLAPRPRLTLGGDEGSGKEHDSGDASVQKSVRDSPPVEGKESKKINPKVDASLRKSVRDSPPVKGKESKKINPKVDASLNPSGSFAIARVDGSTANEPVKRKSISVASDSSNVDRNWKRVKKDSSSQKQGKVDAAGGTPCNPLSIANSTEKLEDETVLVGDDDEQSQDSQGSVSCGDLQAKTSEVGKSSQPVSPNSAEVQGNYERTAVSIFEGKNFLHSHQKQFLNHLWTDLSRRILRTPLGSISSMEKDVAYVLKSMKKFEGMNIDHVETLLKSLFEKAVVYDKARSSSSEKISKELLAQQLGLIEDRLHDAKVKKDKEAAQFKSTKDELRSVNEDLKALKLKKKDLISSLGRQNELLQAADGEISKIEEEISTLKSTPLLTDAMVGDLEASRMQLETVQQELAIIRPFA